MKSFEYENYTGLDEFMMIACDSEGETKAAEIGNSLVKRGVRVFFEKTDTKSSAGHINNECTAEEVSEAVSTAAFILFVISDKAVSNLRFRNEVNFAINKHKTIICLRCDGDISSDGLSQGLDMQLANYDFISGNSAEEIIEVLNKEALITQDVIGEGMIKKASNQIKKIVLTLALLLVSAVIIIAGVYIVRNRVEYYNSAEYALRDADGSEYVDASDYDNDAITALAGKSMDTLVISSDKLTSIEGIENVHIRELILTDSNNLNDLRPLKESEGLEKLHISQNMVNYAYFVMYQGFEIVIDK